MKTNRRIFCLLPFMVFLPLAPARAADQVSAPAVKPPQVDVYDDLPKSTDPLIDPLTGTPYIAVHNGDIVESVIFTIEFQRAHPQEHAVLLTREIERCYDGGVMPAVAFSWKGKVYIHSYGMGDALIPGVLPGQIDDHKSQLENVYIKLLRYNNKKYFEKLNIHFPMSEEQANKRGKADAFPHVLPNLLPGDTEDIQAKRVEARLKKLGLLNTTVYFNFSGWDRHNEPFICDRVIFDYGDFEYAWSKYGSSYHGLAGKTYRPSLIDSIIFSLDYQKANPSEKVFCFLHEASNCDPHPRGDIVSTTVFTKNGQLWFHHCAPGDLPSSLSLDDLKDSDKVIKADLAAYKPAIEKFNELEAHQRHQAPAFLNDYLKGYKAPDLSVTGVRAELQKRGVETKVIGDTDNPELLFVWGKQPYTYKPGIGCLAGNPGQITAAN
jgi:hypothetical protein